MRARLPLLVAVLAMLSRPGAPQAGVPPARRDILGTETKLYSQSDEELIIRDFFQDRRDGFFLDVGCAWPIKDNNTYYLEDRLGWSGIGIDALPEYAKKWHRQRHRSRFFNYIVTDHSGTTETFYRSKLLGISAIRPPVDPQQHATKAEVIEIPTITLNELLDQNGVKTIDLLSMDIEEAEPLALAGFDIERFKPQLACVEAHTTTRDKIMAYFSGHGYERIERYLAYDRVNYYFTLRHDPR